LRRKWYQDRSSCNANVKKAMKILRRDDDAIVWTEMQDNTDPGQSPILVATTRLRLWPALAFEWSSRVRVRTESSVDFSGTTRPAFSAYNPVLMAAIMEREIKLAFGDRDEAKAAILATGATPLRGRRLQEDCLLDTPDDQLRRRRCVLRVRMECGKTLLTFKGPVQASPMKLREELETVVGDGLLLLRVLEQLGFRVWFRYQKYREEFTREEVTVAIDETPVGTFVELEGSERGIHEMATALARNPADYLLDSYRGLFVKHCENLGLVVTDMLFEDS
jgi:adenylate cyclase, class 2